MRIKDKKLASDTDVDVVLNFIDDYVIHITSGDPPKEPLMKLKDLLSLVDVTEKLKDEIRTLGNKFEAAECGPECLSQRMAGIMNEALGSLLGGMENLDPMAGGIDDELNNSVLDSDESSTSTKSILDSDEDFSQAANMTIDGGSFRDAEVTERPIMIATTNETHDGARSEL